MAQHRKKEGERTSGRGWREYRDKGEKRERKEKREREREREGGWAKRI